MASLWRCRCSSVRAPCCFPSPPLCCWPRRSSWAGSTIALTPAPSDNWRSPRSSPPVAMKLFKIFCDLSADAETLALLQQGVAPHEIFLHSKPAPSVLSKSEPHAALAEADVAFGQPDVAGLLEAERLRWLQVSSAGYTRYDTTEFRAEAARRNLLVTNSSTVYAEPCAEHALAFL